MKTPARCALLILALSPLAQANEPEPSMPLKDALGKGVQSGSITVTKELKVPAMEGGKHAILTLEVESAAWQRKRNKYLRDSQYGRNKQIQEDARNQIWRLDNYKPRCSLIVALKDPKSPSANFQVTADKPATHRRYSFGLPQNREFYAGDPLKLGTTTFPLKLRPSDAEGASSLQCSNDITVAEAKDLLKGVGIELSLSTQATAAGGLSAPPSEGEQAVAKPEPVAAPRVAKATKLKVKKPQQKIRRKLPVREEAPAPEQQAAAPEPTFVERVQRAFGVR